MATLAEFVNVIGFKVNQDDIIGVNKTMTDIKSTAKNLLGTIGIGLSLAGIYHTLNQFVGLASEAEEMENKFNVVFKGMQEDMDAWAQNFADNIGRNKNEIKTYLADMQNLNVGFMGQDKREEAAEFSKQMTKMALDLASFNNINEAYAINAMTKAVMGETESAKMLGAVLNEATRQTAMFNLGMTGTYEKLSQADKMLVNYQAIVDQSKDAIDDCERSLSSYRSTMIAFQSTGKEIKTLIGQFFMPAFQKMLQYGRQGLLVLRDGAKAMKDFGDSIGGSTRIIAVFGATLAAVSLVQTIMRLRDAEVKARMLSKAMGILNGVFNASNARLLAMVGGFLMLFMVIDDVYAFIQGHDSIFGRLLEKSGADVDALRKKYQQAFTSIRTIVTTVLSALGGSFKELFFSIINFFAQHGDLFISMAEGLAAVLTVVADILNFLATNETAIAVLDMFGTSLGNIIVAFGIFLGLLKGGTAAMGTIKGIMALLGGMSSGAVIAIFAIIAAMLYLVRNWDNVKSRGKEFIQSMKDLFQGLFDWFDALPDKAFQWGVNLIMGFIDGIKSVIGGVGEFLGLWDDDDGETPKPPKIDYEGARALATSGIASAQTRAAVSNSTSNRSVHQNVTINNQFNGDKAGQQKSATAMNKATDDVSARLARAMAYK